MDLYKLNSAWKPTKTIEGWDSLIWTERYQPCGDFELKTSKITQTLADLPLKTFLGIGESGEVMVVENLVIDSDPDQGDVLTVTGRTYESVLETRTSAPTGASNNYVLVLSPPQNTADMIQTIAGNQINAKDDFICSIDINNIYPSYAMTARPRQVPRGVSYNEILSLLAEDNLGIYNFRFQPWNGDVVPGYFFTGNDPGTYLYNGIDRSSFVIFDVRAGHFEQGRYLWSIKDYFNTVYVSCPTGGIEVSAAGTSTYTALDRRVALLDANDITQAAGATLNSMLTARGRAFLGEHKQKALFEGTVSPTNPYKFGYHDGYPSFLSSRSAIDNDYFLGDTVQVIGDYGVSQKMIVTEYVRIHDNTGERAYPTLDTPDAI